MFPFSNPAPVRGAGFRRKTVLLMSSALRVAAVFLRGADSTRLMSDRTL